MKVVVFGSNGLVGSSIMRTLGSNKIVSELIGSRRKETNLFSLDDTKKLIHTIKPNIIINAAAKVGGILANNSYRSDFIFENLKINMNILESIIEFPDIKVINLGSSCIYPLGAKNPISEESLMTGKLEPTNSPYAMAKLTAIELGDALNKQYGHEVLNIMPTNLYGPNDNFDINNGHVLPSLIAKFHGSLEKSKHWVVKLWGDGSPKREFLHVDDLAEACYTCMQKYDDVEHINVGTGEDVTIKELAETIVDVVGYKNDYEWDTSKPNGTPRKVLNVDKIKSLGWEPKIGLREGIESTYEWYKNNL